MVKNFENWHRKKAKIDAKSNRPNFHEREVWWCALGVNVGFEMDGKGEDYARPVLIIKVFNKEIFVCIPLTTRQKIGKYYMPIDMGDGTERMVILSQIRLVDARRLEEKVATIKNEHFRAIKKAVIRTLE